MLKDIFAKYFNEDSKSFSDKITNSLMDGYVDIKAYKDTENGKELIYHDTGDNVVTNWMRQAIMMLLTGYGFTDQGYASMPVGNKDQANDKEQYTQPISNDNAHKSDASNKNFYNADGYILNGEQYLWDNSKKTSQPTMAANFNGATATHEFKYPYFPSKVLFGTGKEFASWDDLEVETQTQYSSWYTQMREMFGGDTAPANFDNAISFESNVYSGTIGVGGNTTGDSSIIPTLTVNDPNQTTDTSSTTDMASRYGVVGAVKTLYLPYSGWKNPDYLEGSISNEGRLVKSSLRGVGKPCFIYFNRTDNGAGLEVDWDDANGAQIYLTKDATNSKYLNRITFRITMPSQSAGSGHVGEYYPYNGYTLKQIGLFNDAILASDAQGGTDNPTASGNMPCGMLLAIKNIEAFTKTADEMIVLTWTLTI